MKRLVIFGFLICACGNLMAQNQYFFNYYMLNPSFYNPAWVGSDNTSSVAFQYRSQWTGYSTSFDGAGGAPNTQLLSFVVPIMNFPLSGFGINVSNDALGAMSNQQVQFSLSSQKQLRQGNLRFGIMPGVHSQTINFGLLRFNEPDPIGGGGAESQFRPSLTAGLYYTTNRKLNVGISAVNIIESSFDFSRDSLQNKLERSYYITLSRPIRVNEDFNIVPSIISRTDLISGTFDISVLSFYKQKMWGGLSYRLEESLILLLGYNLLKDNTLKVGYSFDYVIHNRDAKQSTSNEILVRYNLSNLVWGGKKSIKTPRFAF